MRKVKSTLKVLFILVLGLSVNLSMAQTETEDKEVKKKEKTITLRTVKMVNGEKVKWDTTLVMTDENKEEVEKYLKEHAHGNAEMKIRLEMLDDEIKMKLHEIEKEFEGEDGLKKQIKMIVEMSADLKDKAKWYAENHVFTISEGDELIEIDEDQIKKYIKLAIAVEDGNLELINLKEGNKEMICKIMKEHKHKLHELKELHKDGKVFAFFMKDGDSTMKIDFDFDMDYDSDMDHENLIEIHTAHDKDFVWVDKDGKHKNVVKRMKFGKKGDKEGNVMFFGDDAHADFSFDMKINDELNDEDIAVLKKAGVKVKSKELAIDKLRLTFEDGTFGLIFKVKTEGIASIKVVDSEGRLVFNDKVQYFPGTYHKSIGLNSENQGTYFVYIEQGGASYTTKVHLN